MPYFLSPIITEAAPPQWLEGNPYESKDIYSIANEEGPPVNYRAHTLRPHSLTHMEAPAHTQPNGKTVDMFFDKENSSSFFGRVTLVRLSNPKWVCVDEKSDTHHWEVSREDLEAAISRVNDGRLPDKIIITVDSVKLRSDNVHDPSYVLTLSQEAADYLVSNKHFNMFGTSWKSTDFKPGSRERPIHNTIFKKAAIFENLRVFDVPEGNYFFVGVPLPLSGASESPVCPVLFEEGEVKF